MFCAQRLEERLREYCGQPEAPVLRWPEYLSKPDKADRLSNMGELVKIALKSLPDELQVNLEEAVSMRNYLAHQFFSSHLRTIGPRKKQEMMNECGMAAGRFQAISEQLDALIAAGETMTPSAKR